MPLTYPSINFLLPAVQRDVPWTFVMAHCLRESARWQQVECCFYSLNLDVLVSQVCRLGLPQVGLPPQWEMPSDTVKDLLRERSTTYRGTHVQGWLNKHTPDYTCKWWNMLTHSHSAHMQFSQKHVRLLTTVSSDSGLQLVFVRFISIILLSLLVQ